MAEPLIDWVIRLFLKTGTLRVQSAEPDCACTRACPEDGFAGRRLRLALRLCRPAVRCTTKVCDLLGEASVANTTVEEAFGKLRARLKVAN